MDQKWILAVVILQFYQKVTSGGYIVKTPSKGQEVDIKCIPASKGSLVVWFRVLDNTGMEFIASFSPNGLLKTPQPLPPTLKSKSNGQILALTSFKDEDSGVYGCASLVQGNQLYFGDTTKLNPIKAPEKPAIATTKPNQVVQTSTPCICHKPRDTNPSMSCPLIILGPLAGGCGLLLVLLITITLYCNTIRTRRCPHHYKRKPRMMEPGKQMGPNSHI